jgi:hypothetical protein
MPPYTQTCDCSGVHGEWMVIDNGKSATGI